METSLAKIQGRNTRDRLKAIEPSDRGRLEYASDAFLVASSYDGQWRREIHTEVSLDASDLPEGVFSSLMRNDPNYQLTRL